MVKTNKVLLPRYEGEVLLRVRNGEFRNIDYFEHPYRSIFDSLGNSIRVSRTDPRTDPRTSATISRSTNLRFKIELTQIGEENLEHYLNNPRFN
jgi:hypothetical protein